MELFRNVQKGSAYESCFPQSSCQPTYEGDGDTGHSIEKMVEVVKKHQNQCKKVAQMLQKNTLAETVAAIHDFLYWHFQYRADDEDQMLRSPACSWHCRYDGIDCKSYSILASCILSELKILHAIRKVSYTTENAYSHVYVIVSINNKDFNKYYIIDGTLEDNIELPFAYKKDKIMNHYSLNRPESLNGYAANTAVTVGSAYGVPPEVSAMVGEKIDTMFKDFKLSNIGEWFNMIGCIGGTAFDKETSNVLLAQIMDRVKLHITEINTVIAGGKASELEALVFDCNAEMNAFANMLNWQISNGWNYCSTKNFQAVHATVLEMYQNLYGGKSLDSSGNYTGALYQYLFKYFDVKRIGEQHIDFHTENLPATNIGFMTGDSGEIPDWEGTNLIRYSFAFKNTSYNIPTFTFASGDFKMALQPNGGFNVTQALQKMTDTAVAIKNGASSFISTYNSAVNAFDAANNTTSTNSGNPATDNTPPAANDSKMSTTNMILIGVGVLAVGYVALKKK